MDEKDNSSSVVTYTMRYDGYTNMLNKYGTPRDNSTAYQFVPETFTSDIELTNQYTSNGLFAKIIDAPAEEAVKHDFDLGVQDKVFEDYIRRRIEDTEFESNAETGLKWARLYGGGAILMIADDGVDNLELPLNLDGLKRIEELRTYERAVITPDYKSLYTGYGQRVNNRALIQSGMPEYYQIDSYTGSFRVHGSRLLLLRNGRLPERTLSQEYRFWGQPEYNKLKRALREAITANSDGVKLLERSVQAIYKMKNLAELLQTEKGEDDVLKRLEAIDLARGILNSIVIDNEGEDYDFKSFTLTGIKDVIDSTYNMLSAISNIPQTILFGRSPAGMNSTGQSDLENYYNYVDRYRKADLRKAYKTYIDLLCIAGKNSGELKEVPEYKFTYKPLWNLSETEQATVNKTNADTEYTKAQTAQVYVDMGALDPTEVRDGLKQDGNYDIQELIDETDGDLDLDLSMPTEQPILPQTPVVPQQQEEQTEQKPLNITLDRADGKDFTSAAILVVKGSKILCGDRVDKQGICGPGGHIEKGETPEQAAIREANEEFGITVEDVIPLGSLDDLPSEYGRPQIFLSTSYKGEIKQNPQEMVNNQFQDLSELLKKKLFPPFKESLFLYLEYMLKSKTESGTINTDGGKGSGNFGHEGREGEVGGSAPSDGSGSSAPSAEWKGEELNDTETRSIRRYTSGMSAALLNESLRNGTELTAEQESLMKGLDTALDKAPTYSGTLKRSLQFRSEEDRDRYLELHKKGNTVEYKEFISTTKNSEDYNPDGDVQVTIIDSKAGKDISYFNHDENEVLYGRNSKFLVLGVSEPTEDGKPYRILLQEAE